MKTATLTFQRHNNIGAMLQCYALQKTIIQNNCENEIIDYICDAADRTFSMTSFRVKGVKKYITSIIGVISRIPKVPAFTRFRSEDLLLSRRYNKKSIKEIDGKYDGYIVGSDNVWNSRLTGLDRNYFLDFASDNQLKASYAASMGLSTPPDHEKEAFAEALKSFAFVSTREESAARKLERITGRKVFDTCDPTIFLSREEWDQIAVAPKETYRYVLAYHMSPSLSFVKFVKEFAQIKGLKIIYIPFPYGLCKCRIKPQIGPHEWLGYIRNAEYIVTDSFHGSVFSVIYEKNLVIKISQLGERIHNLVQKTGLEDRIVQTAEEAAALPDIHYTEVREKLNEYRRQGLQNLKMILDHFQSVKAEKENDN